MAETIFDLPQTRLPELELPVDQEKVVPALDRYIPQFVEEHPFVIDFKTTVPSVLQDIERNWPIKVVDEETRAIWKTIKETVDAIPTVQVMPLIRVRVIVSSKMPDIVLPEPQESAVVATFDSVTGIFRRTEIVAAEMLPKLDNIAVHSGIMIICQPIAVFFNTFNDINPNTLGAGNLYAERQTDRNPGYDDAHDPWPLQSPAPSQLSPKQQSQPPVTEDPEGSLGVAALVAGGAAAIAVEEALHHKGKEAPSDKTAAAATSSTQAVHRKEWLQQVNKTAVEEDKRIKVATTQQKLQTKAAEITALATATAASEAEVTQSLSAGAVLPLHPHRPETAPVSDVQTTMTTGTATSTTMQSRTTNTGTPATNTSVTSTRTAAPVTNVPTTNTRATSASPRTVEQTEVIRAEGEGGAAEVEGSPHAGRDLSGVAYAEAPGELAREEESAQISAEHAREEESAETRAEESESRADLREKSVERTEEQQDDRIEDHEERRDERVEERQEKRYETENHAHEEQEREVERQQTERVRTSPADDERERHREEEAEIRHGTEQPEPRHYETLREEERSPEDQLASGIGDSVKEQVQEEIQKEFLGGGPEISDAATPQATGGGLPPGASVGIHDAATVGNAAYGAHTAHEYNEMARETATDVVAAAPPSDLAEQATATASFSNLGEQAVASATPAAVAAVAKPDDTHSQEEVPTQTASAETRDQPNPVDQEPAAAIQEARAEKKTFEIPHDLVRQLPRGALISDDTQTPSLFEHWLIKKALGVAKVFQKKEEQTKVELAENTLTESQPQAPAPHFEELTPDA